MVDEDVRVDGAHRQVFVSYAWEDVERVRPLVEVLRTQGWNVWWDRDEIRLGERYREVISAALEESHVVIVVWSRTSVRSAWVLGEAEAGLQRRILIPLRIDDCVLPLPFNSLQTADLSGWRDQRETAPLELLLATLRRQSGVKGESDHHPHVIVPLPLNEALDRVYDDESLAREGLSRYQLALVGRRMRTTLVSRDAWLGCGIVLGGEQDRYRLAARPELPWIDESTFDQRAREFEARGQLVFDSPVYRLVSIEIEAGRLSAEFCSDSYFRYRFSNGVMLDELEHALRASERSVERVLADRSRWIPIRHRLMPTAAAVASPASRICSGGINVLVAMARRKERDYALFLQRRSKRVASMPTRLATLPSGHHQPLISASDEIALHHTVRREFLEELFDAEIARKRTNLVVYRDYLAQMDELQWLDQNPGSCSLILTAFGYSLRTGGFSFSVLMVIDDEQYWERIPEKVRSSWETQETFVISSKGNEALTFLEDGSWADYGVCTFVEGLRHLQRLPGDRVDLALPARVS